MGNLTITIERNNGDIDIRYSPTSQQVSRGGTVTFKIQNIPGDVDVYDVTYEGSSVPVSSSPFSQPEPYKLNGDGNALLTASLSETVITHATLGWYKFTVSTSDRTERRRKGEERETKTGNLEVTTDEW